MVRRILALLLLIFAAPAFAQSYSGTASGFDVVTISIPSGPGNYQLNFSFETAVPFDVTIYSEEHFNQYFVDGGGYVGGDDTPYYDVREFYTSTISGFVQWTILPPYSYSDGFLRTEGYYEGISATFQFYADPATSFAYSLEVVAVPEPAQWALMIGGFGFAGAAMRRRSARTALRTI